MAEACVFVMGLDKRALDAATSPTLSHLNIGTGEDVTIRELAETMARVTGFQGRIVFDTTKPDGTPRKLLDVSAIAQLGWRHRIDLESGLRETYGWFVEQLAEGEQIRSV